MTVSTIKEVKLGADKKAIPDINLANLKPKLDGAIFTKPKPAVDRATDEPVLAKGKGVKHDLSPEISENEDVQRREGSPTYDPNKRRGMVVVDDQQH